MNIFDILKNLFVNPKSDWILELDDNDINPVVIQRFLALNSTTQRAARILNKFVYKIPSKMYLSSAWSLLFFNGQKINKPPFIKYPKQEKDKTEKYYYIFDKIKRQYEMTDNDFEIVKPFVIKAIEKDKYNWFAYYGVHKDEWLVNNMDINMLKDYVDRPSVEKNKGLNAWF